MSTILDIMSKPAVDDTSNRKRLIRDSLIEMLATCVFVYAGTLSAASTGHKLVNEGAIDDISRILPIAVAFGVSILVLAYSIGHLTGGHMNPGVSLLMFFRRQLSFTKMLSYWIAQFTGALLASSLVWGSISDLAGLAKNGEVLYNRPPFELGATTLDEALSTGNGFLLEFMGSFFFYFVIAQTALDTRGIGQSYFPAIPIGLSLVVVHICLIPFTGCGVNPARTFGPSMVVCMTGSRCDLVVGSWYWIYWIGPFLAAFVVAEITNLMQMEVENNSKILQGDKDVVVDLEAEETP